MIIKGLRFGMLLQLAVGPMCLFIFQTAVTSGLSAALTGVLGIALIDALYIVLAILGIGALMERRGGLKRGIKYFGAAVLILFGLSIILEVFGYSLIPSFSFVSQQSHQGIFIKVMLLTLSNPLTILFWVGVFSTRLAEDQMNQKDMAAFGTGAILSTLLFLSSISMLGSSVNRFLDPLWLSGLNLIVGLVLIGFGLKTFLKTA